MNEAPSTTTENRPRRNRAKPKSQRLENQPIEVQIEFQEKRIAKYIAKIAEFKFDPNEKPSYQIENLFESEMVQWRKYAAKMWKLKLTQQLEALKEEHQKKTERARRRVIREAIKKAGDPELADRLILDDMIFDHINKRWVRNKDNTLEPIKDFHAIAFLRADEDIQRKVKRRLRNEGRAPGFPSELFRVNDDDLLFMAKIAFGDVVEPLSEDPIITLEAEIERLEEIYSSSYHLKRNAEKLERIQREAKKTEQVARYYQSMIAYAKQSEREETPSGVTFVEAAMELEGGAKLMSAEQILEHIQNNYGQPSNPNPPGLFPPGTQDLGVHK